MQKKTCLLFLAILFYQSPAQTINLFQIDSIRETVRSQFGEGAAKLDLDKYNTIVVAKGDTFFNPGGFNYLFRLKKGLVYRIDESCFHGTTFNRFLFIHNDNIFQLGGYGLFQTNNNLLRFSFLSKEWEAVKTKGAKPAFIQGIALIRGNLLYSFNNRRGGNGVEPDSIDPFLYVLDLKESSWSKHVLPDELGGYVLNYETPDFLYCINRQKFLLIHKNQFQYIIIEGLGEPFLKDSPESHKGNKLVFHPVSSSLRQNNHILNLDSLWQRYLKNRKDLVFNGPVDTSLFMPWEYLSMLLGILLAIVFTLLYKRYKKSKTRDKTPPVLAVKEEVFSNQYYEALLSTKSNVLTMEELDELLKIDFMEVDSRKLKRFRILQEINDKYPGLITRIKDSNDRRRFLYKINRPSEA